jgi:hypothetical protein
LLHFKLLTLVEVEFQLDGCKLAKRRDAALAIVKGFEVLEKRWGEFDSSGSGEFHR